MACTNALKSNAKHTLPRCLTASVVLWATTGCQQIETGNVAHRPPDTQALASTEPEAPEPASKPPAPHLTPEETSAVQRLLTRAEQAIGEDHLTYPSKGSALALYDRVTILDPDNDQARRGLERIVERYLELALEASAQRRFSHARAMLDRARLVDPNHPGIAPTAAQLQMLANARRQVIDLDGASLRKRDQGLSGTLRKAGLASRGNGCRARITARSDSEGRWIYQQMNEAPGDSRITAQLDIGSPPRIEVLCLPGTP